MNIQEKMALFFQSPSFGVIGVSNDRSKFGNKVLRSYQENQLKAYPIHPIQKEIEFIPCLPKLENLPDETISLSVITPYPYTETIVERSIQKGIKNIWMQPGAESLTAIQNCEEAGINVLAGGPCILIELGFRGI